MSLVSDERVEELLEFRGKYEALDLFLDSLRGDVYAEPRSQLHDEITGKIIAELAATGFLAKSTTVLDVGCGQGVALEQFKRLGCVAEGITLGEDDFDACFKAGYRCRVGDVNFMDLGYRVEFVWARQVLDHSPFPYFTMRRLADMLVDGGHMYFEVSAPDTPCLHETNKNHYSIMGPRMWASLAAKCGLTVLRDWRMDFTVQAGPDWYWGALCRKGPG